MKKNDKIRDEIAQEISDELKSLLKSKLRRLILYGSYAYGIPDKDSDIDILALVDVENDELAQYNNKIAEIVSSICMKHGILPSIILESSDRFFKYFEVMPFYQNVQKGIILYV
ncbi:MAG: nucleotidyltransferase domain-containing protein [Bacteroidetes bacterium]|nr:nucleotidyltransferase domain-containing protein [Bacteroidota bacterium]MBU2585452.1 nucleotidyltransferase domain-containing protein [Bacteroidota bacterium]